MKTAGLFTAALVAATIGTSGCAAGVEDPMPPPVRKLGHIGSTTADADISAAAEQSLLSFVLKGLAGPAKSVLGKAIVKIVTNVLIGPVPKDYTSRFNQLDASIKALNALITDANSRLVSVANQLSSVEADVDARGLATALVAPTAKIEVAYTGNVVGSNVGCDPSTAMSNSLCWFYSSGPTLEEKRRAAPAFLQSVPPQAISEAVAEIQALVVSNDPHTPGLLDNYSDVIWTQLLASTGSPANAIDSLETRFLSLMSTQIHGLELVLAYYQMQVALAYGTDADRSHVHDHEELRRGQAVQPNAHSPAAIHA